MVTFVQETCVLTTFVLVVLILVAFVLPYTVNTETCLQNTFGRAQCIVKPHLNVNSTTIQSKLGLI